jgi:diguanylate cyclase
MAKRSPQGCNIVSTKSNLSTQVKSPEQGRRITDSSNISIEMQLMVLAYRNLLPMLIVNLAVSTGVAFILYSDGLSNAFYWLAAVFVLSLLRLWSWFHFNNISAKQKLRDQGYGYGYAYWCGIYAAQLYVGAFLWMHIFYSANHIAHNESKYALSIVVAAMAAGATGIIAPLKYVGRIYITLLLLPSSILLALAPTQNWVLASLCFIFLIAMIISHYNNHTVLRQSLKLQRENTQLILDLQDINISLERRVAKRTETLKRFAYRDVLTGLPNRRELLEWMEKTFDLEKEGEAAVLFLDLDRFKQINDAMGHDVGDQVLQTIALRFKELLPKNAILARWGGDEFILITAQAPDTRNRAYTLATQLIETATAPFLMNGERLGLGLSVGVAYYPTDANNVKDVIQAADLSVAEVKRTGRGQVLDYTDTYAQTQRRRFDLSRALSDAIASNQLTLAYQPIIKIQTGQVVALEALARWNHPSLGNIDAHEFIHLAEDTDRIIALGDWVLHKACIEARSWGAREHVQKIAVNVSVKQLLSDNFSSRIMHILNHADLPANRLQLEVTETLFNEENLDVMLDTVQKISQQGIAIHIDDFGTGYSSLSRLHQFPVNAIKIDRTFIAQVHGQGRVIIESAVMIAQRMNFKVIAEGVETLEQAKILASIGVDYLQGYYFAHPNSIAHLTAFDNKWSKKSDA